MKKFSFYFLLLCHSLALSACGGMPLPERLSNAETIAHNGNLMPHILNGGGILLQAYHRPNALAQPHVRLYIEGDGFAYVTRSAVSPDPTPKNPVMLKVAASDSAKNVVYMGRPCQYTLGRQKNCPKKFWTTHRYSREVVAAYHAHLDKLKETHGIKSFDLVGYSGGGAIAALLAAERDDITALRTVAGNLDTTTFTDIHAITPMHHSLNPADKAMQTKSLPQMHFAGEKDKLVPPSVMQSYIRKQGLEKKDTNARLKTVPDTNHYNWHLKWPALLATPLR